MKDAFPNSMHLSCNAVIFLRDKVERLCLDHSTLGESYVNVSQSIMPDQWMQELNNCMDDSTSPIHKHLDAIVDVLEDVDETTTFRCERLLQLLAKSDKTFLFKLAKNSNGNFTGVVWQTGIMRNSFEKFGHYLALDAMKRELNRKNWCYLACTIINDVWESQT